ncbi:MAG: hypothetical protein JJU22_10655, partial [Gammaproteobacteria bacterium]|nr:hypothetical protein [Gammaproteobacteria bacterium]
MKIRIIIILDKRPRFNAGAPPLWEGPNRTAIGPISKRSPEADITAFAERLRDRRISLREIAL